MKWCDLSGVGCELYVNGSLDGKNIETGLPDFRIKVVDPTLFKDSSLLPLEEHGYSLLEKGDYPEFIRTSKATLKAAEFLPVFGADKINQSILVERDVSLIAHSGLEIDTSAIGFEVAEYHTSPGVKNVLILLNTKDIRENNIASVITDAITEANQLANQDKINDSGTLINGRPENKELPYNSFAYLPDIGDIDINHVKNIILSRVIAADKSLVSHRPKGTVINANDYLGTELEESQEAVHKDISSSVKEFLKSSLSEDIFIPTLNGKRLSVHDIDNTLVDSLFLDKNNERSERAFKSVTLSRGYPVRAERVFTGFNSAEELKSVLGDDVDYEVISASSTKDSLLGVDGKGAVYYITENHDPVQAFFYNGSSVDSTSVLYNKIVFDELQAQIDSIDSIDIQGIDTLDKVESYKEKAVAIYNLKQLLRTGSQAQSVDFDYVARWSGDSHRVADAQAVKDIEVSIKEDILQKQKALELSLAQDRAKKERDDALSALNDFSIKNGGKPINQRVEDYGEKIGGAAKDRWTDIDIRGWTEEDSVSNMNSLSNAEASAIAVKSKLITPYDMAVLKEAGVHPEVAYSARRLMTLISTDSLKSGVPPKAYISIVKKYKSIVDTALEDAAVGDGLGNFIENVREKVKEELFRQPDLSRYRYSPAITTSEYSILSETEDVYSADNSDYSFVRNLENAVFNVISEGGVKALYTARYNLIELAKKNTTLYANPWVKLIKNVANEAVEDSNDETLKGLSKELATKSPFIAHLGNVVREGEDYVEGEVGEATFASTFGFRAVEFGEWLPQKERKEVLIHAFNAFMDLSKTLNLAPKDLSFGGKLAMAFGSRGKSSALAHFEPTRFVINLTRLKGAGSLAHEMMHAFDSSLTSHFSNKYKDFGIHLKGESFISHAIIKNYRVKNKSVSIDEYLLQRLESTVTDEADKSLLKSYAKLMETLYITRKTVENNILKTMSTFELDKGHIQRAAENTLKALRLVVNELRFEIGEDKEPLIDEAGRVALRKALEIIDGKLFEKVLKDTTIKAYDIGALTERWINYYTENVVSDEQAEKLQKDLEAKMVVDVASAIDELLKSIPAFNDPSFLMAINKLELEKELRAKGLEWTSAKVEHPLAQAHASRVKDYEGNSYAHSYVRTVTDYLFLKLERRQLSREKRPDLVIGNETFSDVYRGDSNEASSFYENAKRLDSTKVYYREPCEMLARAGEERVLSLINDNGERSDYLVAPHKVGERFKTGYKGSPYPMGRERDEIGVCFDDLMHNYAIAMNSQGAEKDNDASLKNG